VNGLVLFDVDGTLVRAGDPAHKRAFEEALAEVYGLAGTLADVPIELGGRLDSQIARAALAHHGVDEHGVADGLARVMEAMAARYRVLVGGDVRRDWVLPGVHGVAGRLRERGHVVGVLTGNARAVGLRKLEAAGLAHLAEVGAFGDSAGERWELVAEAAAEAHRLNGRTVDAAATVLVGDTPRDVEAAHRAGARAVGVATARFTTDDLDAAGADAVFADLSDVDAVVTAIEALLSG
jgi:phosphoglycolate phosphatase-like HAD superfamily hydrolase